METHVFFRGIVAVAALLLLHVPNTVIAADDLVTEETLLDRIQIEDLMVRYYADMGAVSGEEMARYYTEDGVLRRQQHGLRGPG